MVKCRSTSEPRTEDADHGSHSALSFWTWACNCAPSGYQGQEELRTFTALEPGDRWCWQSLEPGTRRRLKTSLCNPESKAACQVNPNG
ncbi:unnamed protein product [Caretta caretta]